MKDEGGRMKGGVESSWSRRKWLFYTAVVVLIIVGLLGSAVYSVVWLISRRAEQTVVSVPAAAPVNRIVFINPDGQVVTMDPDGGNGRILTGARQRFIFPAWSPDSQYLAAIGRDGSGSGVYILTDEEGAGEPKNIYASHTENPFYLYWSPDSRQVSFLANHPTQPLGLYMAPVVGDGGSRLLTTGSPLYWDWTSDSDQLLIHVGFSGAGARLSFIDAAGDGGDENIAQPGSFQSPGISANGRYLAYAEVDGDGMSQVVVVDTQIGGQQQESHDGLAAMTWQPGGDQLAMISGAEDSGRFHGPLRLLDAQTGEVRLLSRDRVLAFFWSPNGRYIATITPQRDDETIDAAAGTAPRNGRRASLSKPVVQSPPTIVFNLNIIDVETGQNRLLTTFQPTITFVTQFLPFFDQYALSHRLWSPNSDALVLPMQMGNANHVFVIWLNEGQPHGVGVGDMPFWSQR